MNIKHRNSWPGISTTWLRISKTWRRRLSWVVEITAQRTMTSVSSWSTSWLRRLSSFWAQFRTQLHTCVFGHFLSRTHNWPKCSLTIVWRQASSKAAWSACTLGSLCSLVPHSVCWCAWICWSVLCTHWDCTGSNFRTNSLKVKASNSNH